MVTGLQIRESAVPRRVVVIALGIPALLIGCQESTECNYRTGRGQLYGALIGQGGAHANRGSRSGGIGHLRGHRALPNQFVESKLVAAELLCHLSWRAKRVSRWANRLVSLLRALSFLGVKTRRF